MGKKRMLFSKTGRAVYISHLDLMRTMQRAFRRAGLDMKHSEGFNPHPVMSILLPLSLGQSSVCELMDFELAPGAPEEGLEELLNPALPEGISVERVYVSDRKVKELKWLKVSGRLEYDGRAAGELTAPLMEFFSRGELVITKKTKRGEGDSDIKPAIKSLEISAGEGAALVSAVISAQEPTLNPEHLVSALRQLAPELCPDFAAFCREEVYGADMKIFR